MHLEMNGGAIDLDGKGIPDGGEREECGAVSTRPTLHLGKV